MEMPKHKKKKTTADPLPITQRSKQDLCRLLLRHVIALRLKELDSRATLNNLMMMGGAADEADGVDCMRAAWIEQMAKAVKTVQPDAITDEQIDCWLEKWSEQI